MRRRIAWVMAGALVGMSAGFPAAADSRSDTFQPDVFGTGAALQGRTQWLADPWGRDCALPTGALTLPVAIDLALCRNPTTRSAWAAARQQSAALGQAESAYLPGVTVTASDSRQYGEHADITGAIVSTPQNSRDAALSLSWTLYDFGGRGGRIKSARHLLDAATLTLSSVSQQTVFNVVQSFYGVVAADAALQAAETSEAAGQHSLQVARALREGGAGTQADVLQAETAFDQAALARVQAGAAAKSARGTLSVVIGLPADQPLKLEAEPVPAAVPALTAHVADLMTQAVRQRPDLAAALAQRDSAEANVTVARAAGRPSISIQAGHSLTDTSGVPNQNYSQVGIYVTVPIFNGFSTGYGVRQAQAALEASEANAEQVRLGVSLGVWNAYYSLDSSNQQLTLTAGLIKTAEENGEVALGRYRAGVGTIVDVLTAQAAATLARQTRISAEFGWQVARTQLALALGRLSGTEPLSAEEPLP